MLLRRRTFGKKKNVILHHHCDLTNSTDEVGNEVTYSGTGYNYGKFDNGFRASNDNQAIITIKQKDKKKYQRLALLGGFTISFWAATWIRSYHQQCYISFFRTKSIQLFSEPNYSQLHIIIQTEANSLTSTLYLAVYDHTGMLVLYFTASIPVNAWNNVVVTYYNNIVKLYTNGKLQREMTFLFSQNHDLTYSDYTICGITGTASIDELYMCAGEALWDSDFTPPTKPF